MNSNKMFHYVPFLLTRKTQKKRKIKYIYSINSKMALAVKNIMISKRLKTEGGAGMNISEF